jgi:hypothetical protein
MSKVTIAFASFALGVLTSFFLFSGNHASILAQASLQAPPTQAPPTSMPSLIGGANAPVVPPIRQHFTDFGAVEIHGFAFDVDGVECVRCVFTNGPVLRYGGGNFQFTDFKFSGPVRFELTGAAANTIIFMRFIEALAANQKALPKPELSKNAPIVRAIEVKEEITGSFGTPK